MKKDDNLGKFSNQFIKSNSLRKSNLNINSISRNLQPFHNLNGSKPVENTQIKQKLKQAIMRNYLPSLSLVQKKESPIIKNETMKYLTKVQKPEKSIVSLTFNETEEALLPNINQNYFEENDQTEVEKGKMKIKPLFPKMQNHIVLKNKEPEYFRISVKSEWPPLKFSVFKCQENSLKAYFSNFSRYPNKLDCLEFIDPISVNTLYHISFSEKKFNFENIYLSLSSEFTEKIIVVFTFGLNKSKYQERFKMSSLIDNVSSSKIKLSQIPQQIKNFCKNTYEMDHIIQKAEEIDLAKKSKRNKNMQDNLIKRNKKILKEKLSIQNLKIKEKNELNEKIKKVKDNYKELILKRQMKGEIIINKKEIKEIRKHKFFEYCIKNENEENSRFQFIFLIILKKVCNILFSSFKV